MPSYTIVLHTIIIIHYACYTSGSNNWQVNPAILYFSSPTWLICPLFLAPESVEVPGATDGTSDVLVVIELCTSTVC